MPQSIRSMNRFAQTLSISTTTYSGNDVVGGLLEFNFGDVPRVRLSSVEVLDKAKQGAELLLYLFQEKPNLFADHAQFQPTWEDLGKLVKVVSLHDYVTFTNGSVVINNENFDCWPNNGSLYGYLVTGHTVTYTAASDIVLRMSAVSGSIKSRSYRHRNTYPSQGEKTWQTLKNIGTSPVGYWPMDESPTVRPLWYSEGLAKNLASQYSLESPGPQLITNRDFSNGLTDWTDSIAGATTSEVVNGRFHLVTNATNQGIVQSATIVGGGTYLLTVDYDVQSGTGRIATNDWSEDVTGKGTFQRLVIRDAVAVNVLLRGVNTSEIYYDNVSLRQVSEYDIDWTGVTTNTQLHAPIEGPELITDGGFTGTQHWVSDDPVNGWRTSYQDAFVDGSQSGVVNLTNSVTLVANTLYLITYEITSYTTGELTVLVGDGQDEERTAAGVYMEYVYNTSGTSFVLQANAAGNFRVDNVYAVAMGSDLISNGEFGTNLTGWSTTGSPAISPAWNAGRAHIIADAHGQGILQGEAGTLGSTYWVSFDYEVVSGTLQVIMDTSTNFDETYTGSGSVATIFEADGAAGIGPIFRSSGGAAEFYIDNVRLISVNTIVNYPFFGAQGDWTPDDAAVTVSGGEAIWSGAQAGVAHLDQTGVLTNGRTYVTRMTVTDYTAGTMKFRLGTQDGSNMGETGTFTELITANNVNLRLRGNSLFDGSVDNVFVEDLNGNVLNDPTFATPIVNWIPFSDPETIHVVSGRAHVVCSDSNDGLYQVEPGEVGSTFRLRATIEGVSGSTRIISGTGTNYTETVGVGTHNIDAVFTQTEANTSIFVFSTSGGEFYVDNISIVKIPNQILDEPGFDAQGDWNWNSDWAVSGGVAVGTATNQNLYQSSILSNFVQGDLFVVKFTLLNHSAGSVTPSCGTGGAGTTRSTNGTFTEILIKGTSDTFFFDPTTFTGEIDNVVVAPLRSISRVGVLFDGVSADYGVIYNNSAVSNLDEHEWVFASESYSPGAVSARLLGRDNPGAQFLQIGGSPDTYRYDVDRVTSDAQTFTTTEASAPIYLLHSLLFVGYETDDPFLYRFVGGSNVENIEDTDAAGSGSRNYSSEDWYIGNIPGGSRPFDGLMYGLVLYDTARTDTERLRIGRLLNREVGL